MHGRKVMALILALAGLVGGVGPAPGLAQEATCAQEGTGSEGALVLQIVPEESELEFIFRDSIFTNTGIARMDSEPPVTGEILVVPNDLAASQVRNVAIRLQTFSTGNDLRDRIMQQEVLASDQFPLACFHSTALRFPEGTPVGDEEASIELEGFLELKGVERPVTLTGAAQLSGSQLIAAASTTVLLSHYGIPQPEVPFIPGVAAGGMVEDAVEVNVFIVAR